MTSQARQAYIRDLNRPPTEAEMVECNHRNITLRVLRAEKRHSAQDCEPDPDQLEEAERREIVRIYKAHGCITYNLSQPRKAKFMTPGLPDIWVFRPASAHAWWHEAKRPVGGRLSPAQMEFRNFCADTRTDYVVGDRQAAISCLRYLGVAVDL